MQGLNADEVLRLLRSLIPGELAEGRGHRNDPPEGTDICADTRLDHTPIRADSLDRLHLASALNRLFCLHETGVEDRLLTVRRIGDIAELIAEGSQHTSGLSFSTSGSTGTPQSHHHSWSALTQEAEALAAALGHHRRVIAWLPLHHLYGFVFGVALPRTLGSTVVESHEAPAALFRNPAPDDLIASVPARWRYLLDSDHRFPGGTGVSSTAPLEAACRHGLPRAGLDALVEVYGATETGGIGLRWAPAEDYRLLPYWQCNADGNLRRALPEGSAVTITPLDRLEWLDERVFRPRGRIDDIIQIGGVNVSPQHVARRFESHEAVAACAIRSHGEGSQRRLKAFIVPAHPETDPEELRQALETWAWEHLPAVERPTDLRIGPELPRNAMGKLQDWD
ncbi:4-coumarate--CoA ligase [Halorhodospira halophila]|uniref:4-coumarate--CoA ligase n=1 Tax=Halorhodospira halophila (strain DSM 244 / SL1) TaxID=349124 RepID=A1WY21_HALHL|nr:4-coumarate--CoA ligase [Halorhodospira halophila]ABM62583.1 4-coumarate--CoA ligase [Halorhodospira halophila SL1]MBK1728262.1 4-coumarate--CoA ligase [Halorhodospira halophila]